MIVSLLFMVSQAAVFRPRLEPGNFGDVTVKVGELATFYCPAMDAGNAITYHQWSRLIGENLRKYSADQHHEGWEMIYVFLSFN